MPAEPAIIDWADQQLAVLRPKYPCWDIWTVHTLYRGPIWCARPTRTPVATINAGSPEALIAEIGKQERARLAASA